MKIIDIIITSVLSSLVGIVFITSYFLSIENFSLIHTILMFLGTPIITATYFAFVIIHKQKNKSTNVRGK